MCESQQLSLICPSRSFWCSPRQHSGAFIISCIREWPTRSSLIREDVPICWWHKCTTHLESPLLSRLYRRICIPFIVGVLITPYSLILRNVYCSALVRDPLVMLQILPSRMSLFQGLTIIKILEWCFLMTLLGQLINPGYNLLPTELSMLFILVFLWEPVCKLKNLLPIPH